MLSIIGFLRLFGDSSSILLQGLSYLKNKSTHSLLHTINSKHLPALRESQARNNLVFGPGYGPLLTTSSRQIMQPQIHCTMMNLPPSYPVYIIEILVGSNQITCLENLEGLTNTYTEPLSCQSSYKRKLIINPQIPPFYPLHHQ